MKNADVVLGGRWRFTTRCNRIKTEYLYMRRLIFIWALLVLMLLAAGCMSATGNPVPASVPHSVISDVAHEGSSGRVIAVAFKESELATSSTESKEAFIKGLKSLSQYGQYNESLDFFDQSLAFDNNFTEAWFAKGVAFHNLKRYDEANKCYDRALLLNPADPGVWYMKGITYQDWGRLTDAVECYRNAGELDSRYR
jgi:tetratricopeptide (TPR) repeat protein